MINKIYNILKPLNVPVLYFLRPDMSKNKTGISYHFFNQGGKLYGDGEDRFEGGTLQVDVFSTIDFTSTVNQIRTIMKENKFRFFDMWDSDDSMSNVQYFHKIMIFNYSEEEVSNG